jgi:hypothetical protein
MSETHPRNLCGEGRVCQPSTAATAFLADWLFPYRTSVGHCSPAVWLRLSGAWIRSKLDRQVPAQYRCRVVWRLFTSTVGARPQGA